MEPILIRRIEIDDLREGADVLLQRQPADGYVYGHIGTMEDRIADLRRKGRTIIRNFNCFYVHDRAVEWDGSFPQFLWNLCEQRGLWLRDTYGRLVRFAAYDNPRIVNWSISSSEDRSRTADFINEHTRSEDTVRLDCMFQRPAPWMFHPPTPSSDLGFDDFEWTSRLNMLMNEVAAGSISGIIVNGTNTWGHGYGHEFEGADTGRQGEDLWHWLGQWLMERPASLLEIVGSRNETHIIPVIWTWLHSGGMLSCRDQLTADLAWKIKEARK